MDNDQQRRNDDPDQQWNSTVDEQQRFGDQVRNSPAGKKRKDRTDPQASLPTDRPLGDVRQSDPDWNDSWNDQRLTPNSADTDLDSGIERGP